MRVAWCVVLVFPLACSSNHPASAQQADAGDAGGTGPVDADTAYTLDAAACSTGDDTIGEAGVAPFQDIAAAGGLPATGAMCLAMEDLDGDGHLDLLLGSPSALTLYVGDGTGHFQAKAVPFTPFSGTGAAPGPCAVGDVDADGKPDIVLGAIGAVEAHLLHNAGGGTFQDVQTITPSFSGAQSLVGVGLADFDGDGWLDLVLAPWGGTPPRPRTLGCDCVPDGFECVVPGTRCGAPPVVYTNTGAGALSTTPHSLGAAGDCGPADTNVLGITDYDGDGTPDVFIANDWGVDRLYLDSAGMQFHEVWSTLGTKGYNHGMGAAFEDFDLDGKLDVYVSDVGSDQLYLGASGGLAYHTPDWGVAAPTRFHSGWAPLGEDFDDDGWTDVFVPSSALVQSYEELAMIDTGEQVQSRQQYDLLLRNAGGHGFTPAWVQQTQQASPWPTYGSAAAGDIDGDGRLDVLEAIGRTMQIELLHNASAPQHWIDVRLHGKAPNVDGIGATVTLTRAGAPAVTRYVQRARGSLGSSWPVAHFGLGSSAEVDSITVRWPGGAAQTVSSPGADALLAITQP